MRDCGCDCPDCFYRERDHKPCRYGCAGAVNSYPDIGQPCGGRECDGNDDLCWDCCDVRWSQRRINLT